MASVEPGLRISVTAIFWRVDMTAASSSWAGGVTFTPLSAKTLGVFAWAGRWPAGAMGSIGAVRDRWSGMADFCGFRAVDQSELEDCGWKGARKALALLHFPAFGISLAGYGVASPRRGRGASIGPGTPPCPHFARRSPRGGWRARLAGIWIGVSDRT
ncbi:hypothetical protein GCM10010990_24520 [Croceicoccus mobilis]|uniref:Uncharacterized protein n=1 Tax=Croceicoccus mobilis TaxID=1703339 RepID=A0A916Z395_9SPHN|nr:hypothetical protein GCM10010990_24520 [Croceicoccus mobilis]